MITFLGIESIAADGHGTVRLYPMRACSAWVMIAMLDRIVLAQLEKLLWSIGLGAFGASVLFVVFGQLPIRWWVVDTLGCVLGVAWCLAAISPWVLPPTWSSRVVSVAAWGSCAVGIALVCSFAMSVVGLIGLYGPVGQGGALVFSLIAALLLAYLVIFPAWIGSTLKKRMFRCK